MSKFALIPTVIIALGSAGALAEDRAMVVAHAGATASPETVAVEIRTRDGVLWSGSLTMGPEYGNAYYSQSKNEFAEPCAGARIDPSNRSNTNNSLNFNISRANWQQEPDKFNITFNWTKALGACEGQGTNTYGFNRVIEIERGETTVIEGPGNARVSVTRPG